MQFKAWNSGAACVTGVLVLLIPALSGSHAQTAAPPAPKELPAGPGHDTVVRVCSGCHVATLITSQRKSADDWTTTVIEMRNRGASASDEELEGIVQYLATNFGPTAAPLRINVNTATAADIAGALSLTVAQSEAVVAYRDKNGKFKDLAALEQVPSIDTAKVDAARDRIDF